MTKKITRREALAGSFLLAGSAVVPGGYPLAFTNPLVFDRDGNGFGGVQ